MRFRPRISRLQPVVLALALLFAQWLSFAHELEHQGPLPERDCGMCIAGVDFDLAMPVVAIPMPLAWLQAEAPSSTLLADSPALARRTQRARGPPVSLDAQA